MELQDGFIVGIYNYCDRWCERCEFTSHCRLFADQAELEASQDPGLKAVVDAPPLPEDIPPPPPRWLQELIDDMNRAAEDVLAAGEPEPQDPRLPPEHEQILVRAHEYCERAHAWLKPRPTIPGDPADDPCAVIAWFHTLVPAKIYRALDGYAREDPQERDWPADHDGSAKVALLGIEQSHIAWLQAAERGLVSTADAQAMISHLVWLGERLEHVFPHARRFVRPAFDEPDAVARLRAAEGC